MEKDLAGRLLAVVVFAVLTVLGFSFSLYLIINANSAYTYFLAAFYLVLSVIAGLFNTFTAYSYYRSYFYSRYLDGITKGLRRLARYPTVAVAVASYNEDPEIVAGTIARLKDLDYPKDRIRFYMLDDSTDKDKADAVRKACRKLGYRYMHRNNRKGYKAGALNNLLKTMKEEFIAIFDYDESLTDTQFLKDLLPYFSDEKLSYIQTEKRYASKSFFSDTVDLFDAFFFRFIQPSRALNNTAIFAGSCGLIRASSLRETGGFPEYVIEDTFFSFESDMHGFKSLYIPKVYAYGKPIATFTELVRQQWRYNYGDTQFLGYFMKRSRKESIKKRMSLISSIDYMTHGFGLNYISVMLVLFTLISVLIVFSQLPIAHLSIQGMLSAGYLTFDLELLGVGALFLSIIAPVILTKMYFGSVRKGIMVFLLNFALAFIRAKAAFAAVFRKKYKVIWARDSGQKGYRLLYALRNSVSEVAFSASLIALGIVAVGINNLYGGAWLLWYGALYVSTLFMFYKYK
ncbi:MAG: glycosyltransferase [Candidatus Marsarchaeota archaeon]|nr:glycosyltransferase [Candidatus Marsarchaeota archaeon]